MTTLLPPPSLEKPDFDTELKEVVNLSDIPMGAKVLPTGATFRVWAPRALKVYVLGDFNGWQKTEEAELQPIGAGHWAAFLTKARPNQTYLYYVIGEGQEGYKRDPYARDLTNHPPFPFSNCILQDPQQFPWHDQHFSPPPFHELVIYQLHVGTFLSPKPGRTGIFLDIISRLEYFVALGINAIQPLPIVEFPSEFSLGYNGTDYYSPETDYSNSMPEELIDYLKTLNRLLIAKGKSPYELGDIQSTRHQLCALIDLFHVYGIAVLFDVVYNHAGGGFDPASLYFFDQMPYGNQNNSLYFTDQGWAGGLVFAYWNQEVRQFLINNAVFFLQEYHIDGFRYDEVSVIDRYGGWQFCQDLTHTCRFVKPNAIQIAEYWPVNPAVVKTTNEGGAGFDATWHDGLRNCIRNTLTAASKGKDAFISLDELAAALTQPGMPNSWRAVQYIESHDEVKKGEHPRIPALSDPLNPRSWYARSRSRIAMSLLMTAPCIPMLFMGQEFLEDKQWSDNLNDHNSWIWWEGLKLDKAMIDYLRFTQELLRTRQALPALKSPSIQVFHIHNQNRVIAYHRWVEGIGSDVIVVVNFNEETHYHYQLGFPKSGKWEERFNSDIYDHWVNPQGVGNGGEVEANLGALHTFPFSASLTLPANSALIFCKS